MRTLIIITVCFIMRCKCFDHSHMFYFSNSFAEMLLIGLKLLNFTNRYCFHWLKGYCFWLRKKLGYLNVQALLHAYLDAKLIELNLKTLFAIDDHEWQKLISCNLVSLDCICSACLNVAGSTLFHLVLSLVVDELVLEFEEQPYDSTYLDSLFAYGFCAAKVLRF